jgi:hypothetical protein
MPRFSESVRNSHSPHRLAISAVQGRAIVSAASELVEASAAASTPPEPVRNFRRVDIRKSRCGLTDAVNQLRVPVSNGKAQLRTALCVNSLREIELGD